MENPYIAPAARPQVQLRQKNGPGDLRHFTARTHEGTDARRAAWCALNGGTQQHGLPAKTKEHKYVARRVPLTLLIKEIDRAPPMNGYPALKLKAPMRSIFRSQQVEVHQLLQT